MEDLSNTEISGSSEEETPLSLQIDEENGQCSEGDNNADEIVIKTEPIDWSLFPTEEITDLDDSSLSSKPRKRRKLEPASDMLIGVNNTNISPYSRERLPCLSNIPGKFDFQIFLFPQDDYGKAPTWMVSDITKKLYTILDKPVPFCVKLSHSVPSDLKLFVRFSVVFSSAEYYAHNVTRCPNHASIHDYTNIGFDYIDHVIRINSTDAFYETSESGCHSVKVPLHYDQGSTDPDPILIKLMCRHSCVHGINRRNVGVLSTLEDSEGHNLGRSFIAARVCSSLKRDATMEEKHVLSNCIDESDQTRSVLKKRSAGCGAHRERRSSHHGESGDSEEVFWIPVRGKRLFEYLQDIKEAYLRRHPEYARKYPDPSSVLSRPFSDN